jgi:hypothetical protein
MHFSNPSSKLGFKELTLEVQCFVGTTIGTRLGNQKLNNNNIRTPKPKMLSFKILCVNQYNFSLIIIKKINYKMKKNSTITPLFGHKGGEIS